MTTTSVRFQGRVLLDRRPLRCPGRGAGDIPRRLTLTPTGAAVMASCGERHRAPDGSGARASCWWAVEGLTPAMLAAVAEAKPGRLRAQLPSGVTLEGRIMPPPKEKTGGLFGKKAKSGKAPAGKPSTPVAKAATPGRRSGGGAAASAFGAITAAFQAVGQTAGAVGTIASSASTVAKEAGATARTGMTVANDSAARRFAKSNTKPSGKA